MTTAWQDLRYAVRLLGRTPGFTTAAVAVLALAMGANTAFFSVIEAVLLRPLPYADSQRLCVLWKSVPARNIDWDWTSQPTIRDWQEQNNVFADMAIVLRPEASQVTLPGEQGPEIIQGSKVSGNFFPLLGVAPILGRTFSREEAARGENVVVVSHGFWQRRLGANPDVLGRTLQLDNRPATVIGVMPHGFQFPDDKVRIWMLVTADSRWPQFLKFRVADAFCAIGRLRQGASLDQARAQMDAISQRLAEQHPATDKDLRVKVVPLSEQIAGLNIRRALWLLGAAAFCVLLIACSNIASLLVARGLSRQREMAIRAALGAGRGRLLWQVASENLLLSLAGGLAGLAVAYGALRAMLVLMPAGLPRADEVTINGTVLAFTFAMCVLTGIVFGLLPAVQTAKREPRAALHDGGRASSAWPGINRIRGLLVASQFALAIVLLTGAGLLVRSFLLLDAVQPGFDQTRLLTMTVKLSEERYRDRSKRLAFYVDALQRIETLPGVRGAATGTAVFGSFKDHVPNQSIAIEGLPVLPDPGRHARLAVSDEYFRLLGISLRQGRLFSPEDIPNGPPKAVINETMAHRYWGTESPIGKRFKEFLPGMDGGWLTVIGVVGDVVYNRDGSVVPVFYQSSRQAHFWSEIPIVVRTALDPEPLRAAIRQAVRSVDAAIPYFEIETVDHHLGELDRPRRFHTQLIGVFAVIALILAAIGLYGLMSYAVEQRTREIGIRLALGATRGNVVSLVLRQGMGWVFGGIVIGTAGALVIGHALAAYLFGITSTDPVTFGAVVATLVAVAAAACSLPTLRAAKVDPTSALRHE